MTRRIGLAGLILGLLACTDGQAPAPVPEPRLQDAILFLSDRDGGWQMHLIAPTGGPVKPLFPDTNLLGGGTIAGRSAISPDGRWVAFAMLGDIWVARADGTEPRNLTNHSGNNAYPAWSPDGARIAFDSDRGGNPDIYVMDRDGTHLVQITNDPAQDQGPAWAPDGSRIAFRSDRVGAGEIFVVGAAGGTPIQLTSGPGPDGVGAPAWSADGRTIAFDRTGDIYLMDADGGNVRLLVSFTNMPAYFPAWGPGDSTIAFDTGVHLWLIRPDGTGRVQLTFDPVFADVSPAWSP